MKKLPYKWKCDWWKIYSVNGNWIDEKIGVSGSGIDEVTVSRYTELHWYLLPFYLQREYAIFIINSNVEPRDHYNYYFIIYIYMYISILYLSRSYLLWFSLFSEIGVGLAGFGIAFLFLGVVLFFDKGLLAIGNVSTPEREVLFFYM